MKNNRNGNGKFILNGRPCRRMVIYFEDTLATRLIRLSKKYRQTRTSIVEFLVLEGLKAETSKN